jgi:hypothetical protein
MTTQATYTITTTKGAHTGTLREVCAWQSEQQGGMASIEVGGESYDVDAIDFDAADLDAAERAVREAIERDAEPCQHCAINLPADECGAGTHRAVWIDADGDEGEGGERLVCDTCLTAGSPTGPGYRVVTEAR